MNIEEYRLYCLSKKGAEESIPFSKLPDVLVFKVKGKMFTVTDISNFQSFSIKCRTEEIDELRARYPEMEEPPYFSKKHWSSVRVDGKLPDALMHEWLDTSYDLVVAGLTKKARQELMDE